MKRFRLPESSEAAARFREDHTRTLLRRLTNMPFKTLGRGKENPFESIPSAGREELLHCLFPGTMTAEDKEVQVRSTIALHFAQAICSYFTGAKPPPTEVMFEMYVVHSPVSAATKFSVFSVHALHNARNSLFMLFNNESDSQSAGWFQYRYSRDDTCAKSMANRLLLFINSWFGDEILVHKPFLLAGKNAEQMLQYIQRLRGLDACKKKAQLARDYALETNPFQASLKLEEARRTDPTQTAETLRDFYAKHTEAVKLQETYNQRLSDAASNEYFFDVRLFARIFESHRDVARWRTPQPSARRRKPKAEGSESRSSPLARLKFLGEPAAAQAAELAEEQALSSPSLAVADGRSNKVSRLASRPAVHGTTSGGHRKPSRSNRRSLCRRSRRKQHPAARGA